MNTEAAGLAESNSVHTFEEFVEKTKGRFEALTLSNDILVRFKFSPVLKRGQTG